MSKKNLRNGLQLCLTLLLLAACSQQFTITVNEQAVFDPNGRLVVNQLPDADLQGCINLALRQQEVSNATLLSVLSCANSDISDVERIGQLSNLRFLDLGDNDIVNITPLESLQQLGGLNLANNAIIDAGPLLNIPTLTSVSLIGNNGIPCSQIESLRRKLGENLTAPLSCNK